MKEIQVWDGDGTDRTPEFAKHMDQRMAPRGCTSCGRETPYSEATLIDPFELEVNKTKVTVWLCYACAHDRQRDV